MLTSPLTYHTLSAKKDPVAIAKAEAAARTANAAKSKRDRSNYNELA
jgi:hypothetical protein